MSEQRATVVMTGDAAMGAAILDGMAAARMRQELEAARRELEEQRRKNDIRASRERSYWARKIALARKRYGDNRPLRGPRRWALCALAMLAYAYGEFWKFEERRWRE